MASLRITHGGNAGRDVEGRQRGAESLCAVRRRGGWKWRGEGRGRGQGRDQKRGRGGGWIMEQPRDRPAYEKAGDHGDLEVEVREGGARRIPSSSLPFDAFQASGEAFPGEGEGRGRWGEREGWNGQLVGVGLLTEA